MAQETVDRSRRPLFIAASAGMFVFGITLAILGALFGLPAMRERIHADLAQQGDIFLALYLGIFVSTIIVGPIIDSFGNKIVLIVSAVGVVAGLLGFIVAASFVTSMVGSGALAELQRGSAGFRRARPARDYDRACQKAVGQIESS